MRITTNYQEFFRTTKVIRDTERLKQVGLLTDDILGTFWSHEMEDVLDFCAGNTDFHIVTYLGGGIYINRYDKRGLRFKIADGDSDPEYMLDTRHLYRWMFSS